MNYASSGNKTGIPEKPIRMQDPLHLAYSRSQPFNNVTHDHDRKGALLHPSQDEEVE